MPGSFPSITRYVPFYNDKFAIQTFYEFSRVISTVEVTESGIYKKGQAILAGVGAFILRIELVYEVILTTVGGNIQIQSFNNPPLLDEFNKTGGKVMLDGKEIRTDPGPSTVPLELTTIHNDVALSKIDKDLPMRVQLLLFNAGLVDTETPIWKHR